MPRLTRPHPMPKKGAVGRGRPYNKGGKVGKQCKA